MDGTDKELKTLFSELDRRYGSHGENLKEEADREVYVEDFPNLLAEIFEMTLDTRISWSSVKRDAQLPGFYQEQADRMELYKLGKALEIDRAIRRGVERAAHVDDEALDEFQRSANLRVLARMNRLKDYFEAYRKRYVEPFRRHFREASLRRQRDETEGDT